MDSQITHFKNFSPTDLQELKSELQNMKTELQALAQEEGGEEETSHMIHTIDAILDETKDVKNPADVKGPKEQKILALMYWLDNFLDPLSAEDDFEDWMDNEFGSEEEGEEEHNHGPCCNHDHSCSSDMKKKK